ncbi:glycosyltransferase [Desulfofundulus thermocisternus]|uniref:glycosyltransferase n=1 Tax=Desulfofundulus thermocisternus TaxID=42471 RepID=UPI00217EED73|nr:glycosyltransferase [Desulfofundulus thermocisternus]MCS5694916.1 glycosyltransferase [Desulfofundulus thermocisternus]
MTRIMDYQVVAGEQLIEEIYELARRLAGCRVQHINSTLTGGGVAEILKRLVPMMQEAGLEVRWDVIKGDEDFFRVTKTFHNAFHGVPVDVTPPMLDVYRRISRENYDLVDPRADFIVLHDQQPLGLAEIRPDHPGRWLWYCHIDPVDVSREVWDFLSPWARRCDAAIYHIPAYARNLGHRQYFMPPAIDPLAEKNREVTPSEIAAVIERLNIPLDLPLVVQISRFDRLKDPLGVVQTFRLIRQEVPCRLVLAGGGATDDPEGIQVLRELREEAAHDPDIFILELPPTSDLEINVLQRVAAVVVQKSVREGFGLTVTEAMWKSRPVVASPVGGITVQIINGLTGLAAASTEEMARAVVRILRDPSLAEKLGQNAREHVKKNFILPIYFKRWLEMLVAEKGYAV